MTSVRPVSLVVFDLDGTLVDSRRDIADAANELLEACGARPLAELVIGRMVGEGAALLVARAFAAAGIPEPADSLIRFLELYGTRLLVHTLPYRGMREALDALVDRVPLAVLTNKPLDATRHILEGLDLARYFPPDRVFGGDGPLARKPDPVGLRHLAERAGVELASTLMVGDSVIDWQTARRAPTRVALARYGFGYQNFPIDQLVGDEVLLDSPVDLLRV